MKVLARTDGCARCSQAALSVSVPTPGVTGSNCSIWHWRKPEYLITICLGELPWKISKPELFLGEQEFWFGVLSCWALVERHHSKGWCNLTDAERVEFIFFPLRLACIVDSCDAIPLAIFMNYYDRFPLQRAMAKALRDSMQSWSDYQRNPAPAFPSSVL